MLLLTSTSDLVQLVTGSAGTINVHASYVDNNAGTITPGRTNTAAISTAVTTTVVAAPGSGVQRNLKMLTVANTHASVSNAIKIQHTDGTTIEQLWDGTLAPGENVVMDQNGDFTYYNASGVPIVSNGPGRLLNITLLTSGTTFTTGTGTNRIRARLQAAGGAGGGVTAVAGGAAGGGGAGGYAEWWIAVSPNTGYTYAIGSGGTGVSGATGNAGGNTTLAVGGTTVTTNGGAGGIGLTGTTALTVGMAGAGGAISTNGTVNLAGQPGSPGITDVTLAPAAGAMSGSGGHAMLGAGAVGLAGGAAGNGNSAAALGYGGGGGGSLTATAAARTGGAGGGGCIIIEEYA